MQKGYIMLGESGVYLCGPSTFDPVRMLVGHTVTSLSYSCVGSQVIALITF